VCTGAYEDATVGYRFRSISALRLRFLNGEIASLEFPGPVPLVMFYDIFIRVLIEQLGVSLMV
jgi:hypothetical protein